MRYHSVHYLIAVGFFLSGIIFGSMYSASYFRQNPLVLFKEYAPSPGYPSEVSNGDIQQSKNFTIKYLEGRIVSFSDDGMKLEANSLLDPAIESNDKHLVNVLLNDSTKFLWMIIKDKAIFGQELEDFRNSSNKDSFDLQPKPFIESEIKRSDLSIGDMIVVKSLNEVSNIATSIIAESVTISPDFSRIGQ